MQTNFLRHILKNTMQSKRILIVYNASNDKLSSVFGMIHKVISPKTYACSLCKLTHGNFEIKAIWKRFITGKNIMILYKSDFMKYYPEANFEDHEFPMVLTEKNNMLKELLNKKELDQISNTEELIRKIQEHLIASSC